METYVLCVPDVYILTQICTNCFNTTQLYLSHKLFLILYTFPNLQGEMMIRCVRMSVNKNTYITGNNVLTLNMSAHRQIVNHVYVSKKHPCSFVVFQNVIHDM